MRFKTLIKLIVVFYYLSVEVSLAQKFSYIYPIDFKDETFKNLQFLDSTVTNFNVFFSGESHGISNNRNRHLNLFKYLYYNANVRYYIIEVNSSIGYLFNRYIQTGDDRYLNGTSTSNISNEYKSFLDKMMEFNLSLPDTSRFELLSIDSESFMYRDAYVNKLDDMIGLRGTIPEEIAVQIKNLYQIKRIDKKGFGLDIKGKDKKQIQKILTQVNYSIENNQDLYKKYFGSNYIDFLLIVRNYASEDRVDINLKKNFFNYIVPNYKNGNYFIQYGWLHVQFKGQWLANLIEKEGMYQGKCLNFLTHYSNCSYHFMGSTYTSNNLGYLTKGKYTDLVADINSITKNNFSLIDFSNSPYKENVSNGAKYVFFIKNQLPEK